MDNLLEITGHHADAIHCSICARACRIKKGEFGACRKYMFSGSELVETSQNKYLIVCPISIETMPMLHFFPRAKFLQITTTGCNFNCDGCVSHMFVRQMDGNSEALHEYSAKEIVERAVSDGCMGISFMMNDPIASYFTFLDVAKAASSKGLLVGCSTNGYFSKKSLNEILPFLDYVNIGMKGFSDERYGRCGAQGIAPVLENIEAMHRGGVHVEISCVYERGMEQELKALAQWIENLNKDMPLQIMRFMPLGQTILNKEPTIGEAEAFCQELMNIVHYVYLFNSPGTRLLDTRCPSCDSVLVARDFFGPMGAKVIDINANDRNMCTTCPATPAIKGLMKERPIFREHGFQGGYPFTRGLEMIEAVLLAIGMTSDREIVSAWEANLAGDGLFGLHKEIATIPGYLCLIDRLGKLCGREKEATALVTYLEKKCDEIENRVAGIRNRPRVCYIMGKPFFCLNPGRFENRLVEHAGGISVNKMLQINGRPGNTVSAKTMRDLNPDIIFTSAFLSNPASEAQKTCRGYYREIPAVKNGRIYTHPFPAIDFGSPRWILGLMHIANTLHPDVFSYDIDKEAETFYSRFYKWPFNKQKLNLSFAKPSIDWHIQQQINALPGVN
jgi:pyruvate formate lyase activating enzyme